jgi:hypothetical protein
MIPAIGYMVGAYIITRMLALIAGRDHWLPKASAFLTVFVAAFSLVVLFSADVRSLLPSATTATDSANERPRLTGAGQLRGLSYAQVVAALGQPSEQASGQLLYKTVDGQSFLVYLEDDKVTRTDPAQFPLSRVAHRQ